MNCRSNSKISLLKFSNLYLNINKNINFRFFVLTALLRGGDRIKGMAEIKLSSILVGLLVVVIAVVIFKSADSILSISSGAGAMFSMIFFIVVFYLVFRMFWKKD